MVEQGAVETQSAGSTLGVRRSPDAPDSPQLPVVCSPNRPKATPSRTKIWLRPARTVGGPRPVEPHQAGRDAEAQAAGPYADARGALAGDQLQAEVGRDVRL